MANLEELKDSTFVNLITSVEKIERAGVPKKRGVRREKQAEVEGAEELKDDVVSMITSALSQMDNPDPVPGLSAAQIQALRALYTVINNKSRTDEDLEIALEAAVMQLNPDYTPKMQEVEEEVEEEIDRDRETATGPIRRSERLAQVARKLLNTESTDLDELLGGGDNDEDDDEDDAEDDDKEDDEDDDQNGDEEEVVD